MKRLSVVAVCLILLAALIFQSGLLTNAQNDDPTPPRTYYETLDLDTPESAVDEFVSAFQRRDFPTVYLIFSPHTQFRIPQYLNLLQYYHLIRREQEREVIDVLPRPGEGEHSVGNIDFYFDQLMLAALDQSALLIDLSGKVTILESVESATESRDEGETVIDVITTVENIDGEVVFRMEPAPSGRWRVYQVITEGGDEESIPWSVPPHTFNRASTFWDTPCDDDPPEQSLVDTGEPAIMVDPPCGILGREPEESTPLTITGIHFAPEVPVLFRFELDDSHRITVDQVGIPDENGAFSVEVIPAARIRGTIDFDAEILAVQSIPHYP